MKILKALALATVPIVGVFLCLLLYHATIAVQDAADDERALSQSAANVLTDTDSAVQSFAAAGTAAKLTIGKAGTTLDRASSVLETVNRPCGAGKQCGTLADVAETLHTVRGTFGQVLVAARHEDRNLDTLDAQELQIFADTHTAIKAGSDLFGSADIQVALKNLSTSSASIADSTKQADAILVDARIEADKYTHPPKKKLGFWGGLWAGAQAIHKLSPPLF